MPRFVFRLEPVLGVRCLREELAQQEMAIASARKAQSEERLAETRRLLGETLEPDTGGGFDLTVGLFLDCYRAYLGKRGWEEVQALDRHAEEVEKKRELVVEAMRRRVVLERLKEKQYLDFRAAEAARETKELDDMSTRAFHFRRYRSVSVVKGGE
jgi:flagellar FliJ protein